MNSTRRTRLKLLFHFLFLSVCKFQHLASHFSVNSNDATNIFFIGEYGYIFHFSSIQLCINVPTIFLLKISILKRYSLWQLSLNFFPLYLLEKKYLWLLCVSCSFLSLRFLLLLFSKPGDVFLLRYNGVKIWAKGFSYSIISRSPHNNPVTVVILTLQMKKQRFRGVKQLTRRRSHGFSLMESGVETLISSKLKLKASLKEIFSNMNVLCERYLSYNKLPYDFCTH